MLRAEMGNNMKVVGLRFGFNQLLLTGSQGRMGTGGDEAAGVPGRGGHSKRERVGQTQPISRSVPRADRALEIPVNA